MKADRFLTPRLSRRTFLGQLPLTLLPAFLRSEPRAPFQRFDGLEPAQFHSLDQRLIPNYRTKPPIDDLIGLVEPGADAFISEKYAQQIEAILAEWKKSLEQSPANGLAIANFLSPNLEASALRPSKETVLRSDPSLQVWRGEFAEQPGCNKDGLVRQLNSLWDDLSILNAEFKVIAIHVTRELPLSVQTRIRYDLTGVGSFYHREGRVGYWEAEWEKQPETGWQIRKLHALEQTRSRAQSPVFSDITALALQGNPSYSEQLLFGLDYWRGALDAAFGIDVYGNNGIAVGDFDDDGYDDLYVCQPSGLPNRLYRNRGDGTFEDVTEAAGVGVLDHTACALFADMDNDGRQDLLIVCSNGPLLFLNRGNGKFELRKQAFSFAQPPQGTFTAAAIADYDRDSWLDVYFCLYSYYQGLDQYRFPVPYHDAQNGPPNFLFQNNRDGAFRDVTEAAGLNQNNNRYSFACGWCDDNNDGWPDLYVANDFGRNNLYRNNGEGRFRDVAAEAGVDDIGAGMSVCWFDYDNDGKQDLYVANMWSAEGKRVTMQNIFMKQAAEPIRAHYQKHASGNSLFQNQGNGRFQDKSSEAGVEMGRWAWSADAWDFDHDGYPDLYVVNGMISGPHRRELNSFFWRQVVSRSPLEAQPSRNYELGWNALNELIRSDGTWSGYERNVFYVNNRDGTFSDVSAAVGLDFLEDGRAFVLADIDRDGRLEVILKNRDTPQIRILHNDLRNIGNCVSFKLRGTKSNRDAIGARVTVEAAGQKQTKYLEAGSGFLSQHTKELFFGIGGFGGPVQVTVRWPSGLSQQFKDVPINCRVELQEGAQAVKTKPFNSSHWNSQLDGAPVIQSGLTSRIETWLVAPLVAPDFELPDLDGRLHALRNFHGRMLLMNFWSPEFPECQRDLEVFQQRQSQWTRHGLDLLAIAASLSQPETEIRTLEKQRGYAFRILLANEDFLSIYNILYRYLFERRRNLGIPISFLLDEEGLIQKVYQGSLDPEHLQNDLLSVPRSEKERIRRALPFLGEVYGGGWQRNHFTYGVAYYERGYVDPAIASFQAALHDSPDYPEAHYNLGSLYLKKQMRAEAKKHFQKTIQFRPDYPDALNNLGLIAAEEGQPEEASRYFEEATRRKPSHAIAWLNLGNLFRQQGHLQEAEQALEQAYRIEPQDPEANYSLGMLFAQRDNTERARDYLQSALKFRPDYPEALNNLGVLDLRSGQLAQAIAHLEKCIQIAPRFDQPYLNLARAYAARGEREKAREILLQLIGVHPEHSLGQKMLEQLAR